MDLSWTRQVAGCPAGHAATERAGQPDGVRCVPQAPGNARGYPHRGLALGQPGRTAAGSEAPEAGARGRTGIREEPAHRATRRGCAPVKLLDQRETIMIVVGASLGPDAPDRHAAEALRQEIDRRGLGSLYRRAVLVTDDAWFESELLHQAPTIAVGGPGVNSVSEEFAGQLLTVWTSEERVVVQIDQGPAGRRALLWGVDA